MQVAIQPLTTGAAMGYVALWAVIAAIVLVLRDLRAGERLTRSQMWLVATPVIALSAVALFFARGIEADVTEHIHSTWLMLQGERPFLDFFCHHSPLLYYLLMPLADALPDSAVVLDAARAFTLVLAIVGAALVVAISRRLWGRDMDLWAVGLVASSAIWLQMTALRPDIPATLLAMGAVLLFATSRGRRAALISGGLLGLGLCLMPKPLPLVLLGPLIVWWQRASSEDEAERMEWAEAGLYTLGALIAPALLALWLWHLGLFGAAWEWVIAFNGQVQFSALPDAIFFHFPLGIMALAVAACVHFERTGRLRVGRMEKTFLVALLLAMLVGILRRYSYNNQLAVLLAAGMAAGPARWTWHWLSKRSIVLASLALMIVLSHFIVPAVNSIYGREYLRARTATQALMDISEGEAVLCKLEHHPLVRHDAIDLWQHWQWSYYLSHPMVRERLEGFADELIRTRPAIVFKQDDIFPPLLEQFAGEGLIDDQEAARLDSFLAGNYRLLDLNHPAPALLWVRNDLVGRIPPRAGEIVPHETTMATDGTPGRG
ncbi:MAG: hypothetical protein GF393_06820 [Armatimonadia bacterium]|nr:hypothetical protein [Armatimonadia bacterium]